MKRFIDFLWDKFLVIFLLFWTFVVGFIALPFLLGLLEVLGELILYLTHLINGSLRQDQPHVFWGASVVIGLCFTVWNYRRRSK